MLLRWRLMCIQAPPGAGKTSTVPLALLLHQPEYLKPSKRIVVSQRPSAQHTASQSHSNAKHRPGSICRQY